MVPSAIGSAGGWILDTGSISSKRDVSMTNRVLCGIEKYT